MRQGWIKALFVIAGIYDGLLGLAFLFAGPLIFRGFGVTPPNHFGYIYFPSLLLIIFGVMFLRVAKDAKGNRELILYGIALKASYAGLIFWYQVREGVPGMFIPWAWADLIFLVLFVIAWKQTATA